MRAIKFSSLSGRWRSMMITDKALVLSSKPYESFEAMLPSLTGTAVLEDKEEIWYQSLEEISYLKNGENIVFKRNDFRNNPVLTTVLIKDITIINELVEVMTQEATFIKSVEKADTFRVAKIPLFSAIFTSVFTIGCFFLAKIIENGEITTKGKNFLVLIFLGVLEVLGTIGVLIVGILLTSFFIYRLVKKIKNPPSLIRLKKVKE